MSVRKIIAGLLFSGISLLALSGCAVGPENNNPTQLTSQWVYPAATFEQKTITGLLVTAVVENPTNRRIFEDIACNVLALHGIPSTPSYRAIPQASNLTILGGGLNYSALFSAAKLAKASNVLAIHQTGTKTNVIYDPGMTWGPDPFWGPGPWGGPFGPDPFWGGWAIPPSITQQNIIESNTELVSVKTGAVLWTGAFSTVSDQAPITQTLQEYVGMVLQAILNNGFLIPVSMPNYQIQPAAKFNPQSAGNAGALPR